MGFWQMIGAAWRSAFMAIRGNLPLFLVILVLHFIVSLWLSYMSPPLSAPSWTDAYKLNLLASCVVTALLAVLPMIAVHRYILRGETGTATDNWPRAFYFAIALIIVRLTPEMVSLEQGMNMVSSTAILIVYICLVRFILVFPLTAIDATAPWRTSWALTRSHWWFSFGIMLFGFLPLVLLMIVLVVPMFRVIQVMDSNFGQQWFRTSPVWLIGYNLCEAIQSIIFVSVGAALASELYRKYGPSTGLA